MPPSTHRAESFASLIGPAAHCGRVLQKRLAALDPRRDTLKILLHGAPGVGKSELARLTAEALCSADNPVGRHVPTEQTLHAGGRKPLKCSGKAHHPTGLSEPHSSDPSRVAGAKQPAFYAIEKLSAARVTAETVRRWHDALGLASLFSPWTVKILEEVDQMPHVAQVLALDYLDSLRPGTAILATSNATMDGLEARFQRRFQCFAIGTPATEDVIEFLGRWPELSPHERKMIAVGSAGCVGAALMDAQTALDLAA